MRLELIFTPNDTPTITYVDRSEHKLEQTLREYCAIPKMVVSVVGPSKSGKTVLINKVVPREKLIPVIGVGLATADDLWHKVLNWFGRPQSVTLSDLSGHEVSGGVEGGGKVGIPLVAQGEAKLSAEAGYSSSNEKSATYERQGIEQVIKEIGGTDFVVFIDDFHYIRPEIQVEIGKQIKVAAENGVKIITASVPHRSDDVVRSNSELRGRVASVDLGHWDLAELVQIARKGFLELNATVEEPVVQRLAAEAFGSPQLMQAMCLNLCYALPLKEALGNREEIKISTDILNETLLRTSSFADFSKMISALQTGPRIRGTERKDHNFIEGSSGDVYRSILLAIKEDPATLSFSYDEILGRVKRICVGDSPVGSSVTSALEQMDLIAKDLEPNASPLSWDGDILAIVDPYLLFFLRWSQKLSDLGIKR